MLYRALGSLAVLCLATGVATAQSPFLGTWQLDPARSRMPDEMKVQSRGGNTYTFDFGAGPETIVADGSDQPGLDGTLLSVKAEGPDTWIVQRKKGGRLWIQATWKLSDHDTTITDAYRQLGADGPTLSMDYIYRRAGQGSGIAGDWQSVQETMRSPFPLEVKPFHGDGFSFVSPVRTTNVTFDDPDHAKKSPRTAGGTSTSMRRVDDRTLRITFEQGGKETVAEEVALSSDLKTLTLTVRVVGRDKPNVLVFERQ